MSILTWSGAFAVFIDDVELVMDTIKHAVEKKVYLKGDRRLTVTYKTNVPVVGSYVQVDTGNIPLRDLLQKVYTARNHEELMTGEGAWTSQTHVNDATVLYFQVILSTFTAQPSPVN